MPEPIPRPMRFLFSFAFLGARRLERLRIAIVSSLNAGCSMAGRLAFLCWWLLVVSCWLFDRDVLQQATNNQQQTYSTTRTRWGTLATMPRMDGVSSRSTIWLRRVKPRPLTTSLCLTGVQIFERKYCSLIVAVAFF